MRLTWFRSLYKLQAIEADKTVRMARINNKLQLDYDARLTAGYRYSSERINVFQLIPMDHSDPSRQFKEGGGGGGIELILSQLIFCCSYSIIYQCAWSVLCDNSKISLSLKHITGIPYILPFLPLLLLTLNSHIRSPWCLHTTSIVISSSQSHSDNVILSQQSSHIISLALSLILAIVSIGSKGTVRLCVNCWICENIFYNSHIFVCPLFSLRSYSSFFLHHLYWHK